MLPNQQMKEKATRLSKSDKYTVYGIFGDTEGINQWKRTIEMHKGASVDIGTGPRSSDGP